MTNDRVPAPAPQCSGTAGADVDGAAVVINTRNLSGALTGVQRYTQELRCRLPGCTSLGTRADGLAGHGWEQWTLPQLLGGRLLWSPANTGPVRYARQVVTIHDAAVFEHPGWFDRKFAAWYRWLLPRLAQRVQHLLTVSEYSRRQIVRHTGVQASKITVTPLAADARFSPAHPDEQRRVRQQYALPSPYLLVLGSLEPRKNLAALFGAWTQWVDRPADLQLVVVGGQGRAFRDAGFQELPPDVRLLGAVDDADLPALYSAALGFVYPSLYEGFGLPPLEAMACGTPVITSGTTSLPEVVGDAALLINPADAADLLVALRRLCLDDALRRQLRARGLGRAAQFSWDRTAAATLAVLQREAAR